MHVFIYVYIHVCIYMNTVCRYARAYICIYTCMYIYIHTCIHTYMYFRFECGRILCMHIFTTNSRVQERYVIQNMMAKRYACMLVCMYACMHTSCHRVQSNTHYKCTYINTLIHAYILPLKCAN